MAIPKDIMAAEKSLSDYNILLGYRGSIAHKMYVPSKDPNSIDDKDAMGVCVPPLDYYIGMVDRRSPEDLRNSFHLRGTKEIKRNEWDIVIYELRKFIALLLDGNPNVLSLLWLPEHSLLNITPEGHMLMEARKAFVGRHVYHAFIGYAKGQFHRMTHFSLESQKIYAEVEAELKRRGINTDKVAANASSVSYAGEDLAVCSDIVLIAWFADLKHHFSGGYMGAKRKDLVQKNGYDTKNAAHLIRLLRMLVEFMKDGELYVERFDAQELLEIKRGEWSLDKVKTEADRLFKLGEEAWLASSLPARPDYETINTVCMNIIVSRCGLKAS